MTNENPYRPKYPARRGICPQTGNHYPADNVAGIHPDPNHRVLDIDVVVWSFLGKYFTDRMKGYINWWRFW